jgi:hypothetical protein
MNFKRYKQLKSSYLSQLRLKHQRKGGKKLGHRSDSYDKRHTENHGIEQDASSSLFIS